MTSFRHSVVRTCICVLVWCLGAVPVGADVPKVPEGFQARLVASVPAVEFPCQVATAPGGMLFVAEDPMDQRGPYEAFDGRILLFRDTQEPIVFADKFRAIQGMAWRNGALYVCHMPFLTVVHDTDGDGVADKRDDLFKDLGPTNNQGLNDHIVSGIQFGMDGWLYISVGDKGVPGATRVEDGKQVQLKGGGVLRCRPDGTELEVHSSGTRNHLEANLDAADNVITYDNTDDGDGWWTRVTHHIYGGYYGYPYDYHAHADRFLSPMGEYGGGSPCGAVFYRDDAWPESFRGIGLWAEWGKSKVHAFRFEPDGASFKIAEAIDFAVPGDAGDFRPIDLALSDDGKTLYIADWNMGGWGNKNERVGRVWAIEPSGDASPAARSPDAASIEDQLKALSHPAYSERIRAQLALIKRGLDSVVFATTALRAESTPALAKRHLIWVLDALVGATPEATMPLLEQLESPHADIRAQAARALGQRRVPIATEPLLKLLADPDPSVRLQSAIALGRIGDPAASVALAPALADSDRLVAFAARRALRTMGDWKALADEAPRLQPNVQNGLVLAAEGVFDVECVNFLIRSVREPSSNRPRAMRALAESARKAKPWDGRWWGTRPSQGKRPALVDDWEGTEKALACLQTGVSDTMAEVRVASIESLVMLNERDSIPLLRERLHADRDAEARAALVRALGDFEAKEAVASLVEILKNPDETDAVRDAVLPALRKIGRDEATPALIQLLNDSSMAEERQPAVIAILGAFKSKDAVPPLVSRLESQNETIRASAAEALGKIGVSDAVTDPLRRILKDQSAAVRRAAALALGTLGDRDSVPALIAATDNAESQFEAMTALAKIADIRALRVYVRGLSSKNADLRRDSASALSKIRDDAAPVLEQFAERKEIPPSIVPELKRIFAAAEPIRRWKILGPFARDAAGPIDPTADIDTSKSYPGIGDKLVKWRELGFRGRRTAVDLGGMFAGDERKAYAYAELDSPSARRAEFAVASDDTLTIWVNGKQVYDFQDSRGISDNPDRFEVDLQAGKNQVVAMCGNRGGGWEFSIAVGSPADYAFLRAPADGAFNPDAYAAFAREHDASAERGRTLFADLKGLACIKCHKAEGQGGDVGPDLGGVGARYGRDELIESLLFPSARVFSGYEPVVVATRDGQVHTGILKSDDADALVIQDSEARLIHVQKSDIEERRASDVSLMPTGLAEGLTPQDFADVIRYLESLKTPTPNPGATNAGVTPR